MSGHGWTRRQWLRATGGLCATGLCAGSWLRDLSAHADALRAQRRACVLIWLDGGPSHLDTFDPKPHAPAEVRGELATIATRVPGLALSELFPSLAQQADRLTLVRGMTSPENDHDRARYHVHTGHRLTGNSVVHPSLGVVAGRDLGTADSPLPNCVLVRDNAGSSVGVGAGFLGPGQQPLEIRDVRQGIDHVRPAGPAAEFQAQLDLWTQLEREAAQRAPSSAAEAHRTTVHRAVQLMRAPQLEAFDLSREPAASRELYGDTPLGLSCLLARRLIEAGVPVVEINASQWDQHQQIYRDPRRSIRQTAGALDRGLAALLTDLQQRERLAETLVVVLGEFGRTPRLNRQAGRDHYSRAWSLLLAGRGLSGGQVIGRTDATGAEVVERPVTVGQLCVTLYRLLGLDPQRELPGPSGRPLPLVSDNPLPEPLPELFP